MSISVYRVLFHYEESGKVHQELGFQAAFVAAATADPAGLITILGNNGKAAPAGTVLKIDSISNHGAGVALT